VTRSGVFDPHRDVGQLGLRFDPGPDPLDQVFAGEAEAGVIEAGEEHLAGLMGADGVVDRQRGLGIHHLADRRDAELAQHRHRHLDPGARRLAQLAGVDQLADRRLVLRRRDDDAGNLVDAPADRLQQLAPAGDLVEEDQQRPALVGPVRLLGAHVEPTTLGAPAGTSAPSPPMIAWRAPGTPYS
jgi:hypothetical protein